MVIAPSHTLNRITPRALLEAKRLSDPQIHPDGQRVAFVVTEADFDESHWTSHLWITEYLAPSEETANEDEPEETVSGDAVVTEQGKADDSAVEEPYDPTRQLTFSGDGEQHPRWSHDGRYLAFISSRPDETEPVPDDDDDDATDQIWILPVDGGEARKVTSAKEGVLDYLWVPGADCLLYIAPEPRPAPLESLRKEERDRRKVDPIVEQDDRLRRQIWRIDVDDSKPKRLYTSDYGLMDFALSPEGDRIAFVTNYSGEGNDYHLADLYIHYLKSGQTVKLVARAGGKYHLRWSPDGTRIAFLSWLDPLLSYSRESLFVADVPEELPADTPTPYGAEAPGLTECHLLTDLDFDIANFEWAHQPSTEDRSTEDSDTTDEEQAESKADDKEDAKEDAKEESEANDEDKNENENEDENRDLIGVVLAAVRTGSEIYLLRNSGEEKAEQVVSAVPATLSYPAQEAITEGADGAKSVPSPDDPLPERYDLCRDPGSNAIAFVQEGATALPEICFRDAGGTLHTLTKLNADFSKHHQLPRQEIVTWTSRDGMEIEGILTRPAGSATAPLPLVVQIHGGPKGRASMTLNNYSIAPVWAAEGYAVLRPNFRGSEGYGNAFAIANRRDLGGGDFEDIMAGVDWCIGQGIADPQRLGVMGGSYGGYMTNWVIGHSQRFKAAISMFGIFHLQTDYSNSELSRWDNDYLGAYYWEDPDIYRQLSPGSYLEAIKTPTLILHGDEDTNTFISNSRELYQALRHRGVTTQFVHYPREGHGLREPNHKLDELRRCLAWMDLYLRDRPALYRIGDRVPGPTKQLEKDLDTQVNSGLELNIVRAEIATFAGQPSAETTQATPSSTETPAVKSELLEVAITIHNVDTRLPISPLTLPLADLSLEFLPATASTGQDTTPVFPVGVPLDTLGGKILLEGDNLRTVQHPDTETGQLAFGFAAVFRVSSTQNEAILRVADFPPVHLIWSASEHKSEHSSHKIQTVP